MCNENFVEEIFFDLKILYKDILPNEAKANQLRKYFEKVIKCLNNIPENRIVSLRSEWEYYCNINKIFSPLKYSGHKIISLLNKFSHYTKDRLSNDTWDEIFKKTIGLLGLILEYNVAILNDTNSFESGLNYHQKMAVRSNARITLVEAGPGTGKTFLIERRIIKMAQNFKPKEIVALAFTNEAANNLRNRVFFTLLGEEQYELLEYITIGTFHSFALKKIKEYYEQELRIQFDYEVIDEEEYASIAEEFGRDKHKIKVYLEENKIWTFDLIISKFLEYLSDKLFVNFVAKTIKEIIIDEAQDLNKIQYEILKKILNTSPDISLFAVGDPRQNIYDFRDGNLNHLLSIFNKNVIKRYYLKVSYRCPNRVLEFVNEFKFNDTENHQLINLEFKGRSPMLFEFNYEEDEARFISTTINSIISKGNISYNDFAVLGNTRYMFSYIADEFNNLEIPFKVFGGRDTLKSEILIILNVLRAIQLRKKYPIKRIVKLLLGNYSKNKDLVGLLNNPKNNFIDTISKLIYLLKESAFSEISFYGTRRLQTIIDILNTIKKYADSKFNEYNILDQLKIIIGIAKNNKWDIYKTFEDTTNNNLKEDILDHFEREINLLFSSFKDEKISVNQLMASISPLYPSHHIFYNKILKYKHSANPEDFVTFSTIHSAKGKEWPFVFIIRLSDGDLPYYNSKNINSELKKFYVACTRAEKCLIFTRTKNIQTQYGPKSRYLSPFLRKYKKYEYLNYNSNSLYESCF